MLTHNTATSGYLIPVVMENPEGYPFAQGERDAEWHETTEEEYKSYVSYWNAQETF